MRLATADYTHVTLVIDRSGSMVSVVDEAQSGINALLEAQFALPGLLTVTLVEFDSEIETVTRMATKPVPYVLKPRGMTKLLDAVGGELEATQADIKALAKARRPDRVMFVVATDGDENSSSKHTLEGVRSTVESRRKKQKWIFQFIGAGDSAWQGTSMGMPSASFSTSRAGARASWGAVSFAMKASRAMPVNRAGDRLAVPRLIEDDEDQMVAQGRVPITPEKGN